MELYRTQRHAPATPLVSTLRETVQQSSSTNAPSPSLVNNRIGSASATAMEKHRRQLRRLERETSSTSEPVVGAPPAQPSWRRSVLKRLLGPFRRDTSSPSSVVRPMMMNAPLNPLDPAMLDEIQRDITGAVAGLGGACLGLHADELADSSTLRSFVERHTHRVLGGAPEWVRLLGLLAAKKVHRWVVPQYAVSSSSDYMLPLETAAAPLNPLPRSPVVPPLPMITAVEPLSLPLAVEAPTPTTTTIDAPDSLTSLPLPPTDPLLATPKRARGTSSHERRNVKPKTTEAESPKKNHNTKKTIPVPSSSSTVHKEQVDETISSNGQTIVQTRPSKKRHHRVAAAKSDPRGTESRNILDVVPDEPSSIVVPSVCAAAS